MNQIGPRGEKICSWKAISDEQTYYFRAPAERGPNEATDRVTKGQSVHSALVGLTNEILPIYTIALSRGKSTFGAKERAICYLK